MQYLLHSRHPDAPFLLSCIVSRLSKKNIFYIMSKAKPVDQREHRIRPKVVDIGAYKKREIPKLRGRYLKITKLWWEDFWTQ